LATVLALATGLGPGCGKKAGPAPAAGVPPVAAAPQAGRSITVCMLPKKKGIPYFSSCAAGAEEAAKALGHVTLIYDGPTDGSPEKAAAMIETWTLKKVDAIAVSPNDPEVLAPAMKKARESGIKVITWDADGLPGTREFFVNQATSKGIGYALVDTLAKDIGGEPPSGDVAIITATLTAANQNAWMEHMKERLKTYPGLKLVAVKPSNEDQKVAFQVAQDLMKAYPNLKGIFGISSVAFPGAAEAVRQAGRGGQVLVTGLSTPNNMREFVLDGTVTSVILWNTADLGRLTVYVAEALVSGQLRAGGTEFGAGPLGAKVVEGDNILLGDILVFTKDNIVSTTSEAEPAAATAVKTLVTGWPRAASSGRRTGWPGDCGGAGCRDRQGLGRAATKNGGTCGRLPVERWPEAASPRAGNVNQEKECSDGTEEGCGSRTEQAAREGVRRRGGVPGDLDLLRAGVAEGVCRLVQAAAERRAGARRQDHRVHA
jgi:ABC-type sugar transport system substrate-binding protein